MRFSKRFPTGRYASPDGPVDIPVTRVKHWTEQFARMRAAGLKIPLSWGHVSTALPADKQAELEAKHNAGYVEDLKQADNGDLEIFVDVADADAAAKVGKAIRDASPLILPEFRDGAGNQWADVIGHVALCPQGVISGQSEWEPVAGEAPQKIALALSVSANGKTKKAMRLGMPLNDDVDNVAKETDESESNDAPGEIKLNRMDGGKDDSTKTQLLALLDSAGLPIGDYTELDDLVEKLTVALNVKKSHNEKDAADQATADPAQQPLIQAEGAPIAMSLTQIEKNPTALALFNHVQTAEKATLTDRLGKCLSTGRATPAMADKFKPEIEAYRLSLSADGKPQATLLHAQLDLLESLPAGAVWEPGQKAQKLGLSEVPVPAEIADTADPNDANAPRNPDGSPMSKEQQQETIDRLAGRRFIRK